MMWGLFRKKRRYLVTCPRCGSHQVEEEGYVSTICSACGYGFAEEEAGRQPFESQNGSNGKSKEEIELVHCYRCGKEHIAQRSSGKTVCPNCGAVISFEDRQIEGRLSEAIDTRGDLIVAPLGNLFSSLAVCRNAEIMGRFAGILICEGRLSLLGSGVFPARIRAQEVVVGGEANVSCPYSLQAGRMIVRGVLVADVAVNGTLHIFKKGKLRGDVVAKSIQVDKGGVLEGNMRISKRPWDPKKFLNFESRIPELKLQLRRGYYQRPKIV